MTEDQSNQKSSKENEALAINKSEVSIIKSSDEPQINSCTSILAHTPKPATNFLGGTGKRSSLEKGSKSGKPALLSSKKSSPLSNKKKLPAKRMRTIESYFTPTRKAINSHPTVPSSSPLVKTSGNDDSNINIDRINSDNPAINGSISSELGTGDELMTIDDDDDVPNSSQVDQKQLKIDFMLDKETSEDVKRKEEYMAADFQRESEESAEYLKFGNTPTFTTLNMDAESLRSWKGDYAQLKNGKAALVPIEKKLSLELHPETIKGLSEFHTWLLEQDSSLSEIPEQFYTLLAMYIEENDFIPSTLANRIQTHLSPVSFDFEEALNYESTESKGAETSQKKLSAKTIQNTITKIAERKNYGIPDSNTYNNGAMWRWEVQIEYLPQSLRPIILERRSRRSKAAEEIRKFWNGLSEEGKELVMKPTGGSSRKRRKTMDSDRLEQTPSSNWKPKITEEEKLKKAEARRLEKEARDLERQKAREAKAEAREQERQKAREAKAEAKAEARRIAQEKKEAAIKAKEEDKRRKEEAQPRILNFVKVIPKEPDVVQEESNENMSEFDISFPQFHVKQHVTIASSRPLSRVVSDDFDDLVFNRPSKSVPSDYLNDCKSMRGNLTKPASHGEVCIEIASQLGSKVVKLLQFGENYRPAFYGTWNRQTKVIRPRNPFLKDSDIYDYDYDSDDEWEEEEEGDECLSDEGDDEEAEVPDSEDQDDGWLVPHGYLSEDEGVKEDNVEVSSSIPASQSSTDERGIRAPNPRKRLEILQPIILGPYFQNDLNSSDSKIAPGKKIRLLAGLAFPIDVLSPLNIETPANETTSKEKGSAKNTSTAQGNKKIFPEDLVPSLIKVINGTTKGVDKLVEEFRELHPDSTSKVQISNKIKEIAVKERKNANEKQMWHVKEEHLRGIDLSKS